MNAVYLDYHATTPVDPRVLDAMLPFFTERFGNPHSKQHAFGWDARDATDRARTQVAALINATAGEITFTGGATESSNLALKGAVAAAEASAPKPRRAASTAPFNARLLDSVAPLVKVISPADALMSAATCARAVSVASRASQPKACCLLWGLPNRSVKNGSMASRTLGSTGVVA